MPKFIGWIPTQPEFIEPFFELCPVSSSDVVYDLGSGDGRLLFAAAERGAGRCVGIDIDPDRVLVSREATEKEGLANRISFIEADVIDVNLSGASVIFCYLFPSASTALKPKFEKELKPGTRVVMESFPVPGWEVDRVNETNGRYYYFYTMPTRKTVEVKLLSNNLNDG
jgi:ubiquinone/menaquinone biosynthesis C-methylase UbiE